MKEFSTLSVAIEAQVAQVTINRPRKLNAMNLEMWKEIKEVFLWIRQTPEIRVATLSGNGRHFCTGIDLELFQGAVGGDNNERCEARRREALRETILELQSCLTAVAECTKPVLAAIHGGCIGGGLDLVACCDIRYSTKDAFFTIKEVDLGMVADVGSLQRLPGILGDGMLREMAYTGRNVQGEEAKQIGLVNNVYLTKEELLAAVQELAVQIAQKSPVAIRGIKKSLLYAKDHTVAEGLDYIATWNSSLLLSEDVAESIKAFQEKRMPLYKD